jgi:hypothetical protein
MRARTGLGVSLLVGVFTVTACGGDPTPQTPAFGNAQQLVQAVSTATARSGSVRFTTDMFVGGVQTKGQGQARATGATALTMTMDFFGDPMEMRLVGQDLFAKVPDAARADVGTDKPWVRINPDGTDPFSQVLGGSLTQVVAQNDSARTIEQIRRAGTLVKSEHTQLAGRSATHYWIDVELAKLGGELPAGVDAAVVKQLQGKVSKLDLELWLDDGARPEQVLIDLSPMLAAAGAPAGSGAKITTDYSAWGAPVDVEAPPPDQVGSITTPP